MKLLIMLTDDECKWCCFDNTDPKNPEVCRPYSDELKEDGPCNFGFCEVNATISNTKVKSKPKYNYSIINFYVNLTL